MRWIAGPLLVVLLVSPLLARPEGDLRAQLEELRRRLEQLERRLGEQQRTLGELRRSQQDLASLKEALGKLQLHLGVTAIVQGSAGNDLGDATDASYSGDLEFSAEFGRWGHAYLHLEGGDAAGLTDEVVALSGVNADALDPAGGQQNDFQIVEAYWELPLLEERLVLTVGKLDPTVYFDANAVANDEVTQFLADIFVNNIAMEWPDYGPGLRLLIRPREGLEVDLGYLSGDSDWEDLLEEGFAIGEVRLAASLRGRPGTWRLYGWTHRGHHLSWSELFRGEPEGNRRNWGLGLSLDQQLADGLTCFCRFGMQDREVAGDPEEPFAVACSWSLGFQLTGAGWGREGDVLGVAFGQALLSDNYRRWLRQQGVRPARESHLEVYYSLELGEHVHISPDLQLIWNQGGHDDRDVVTVVGTRLQVDF